MFNTSFHPPRPTLVPSTFDVLPHYLLSIVHRLYILIFQFMIPTRFCYQSFDILYFLFFIIF